MSIFRGPDGLQNTTFAILDPEGRPISRGSRSPQMTYDSLERFLGALEEISIGYEPKAEKIEALPVIRDLRLALNVAAADMRPLVVVRGGDPDAAVRLERKVAQVAWSDPAVGRFHYVLLGEETTYEGLTPDLGVSVIQPDPYGRGGQLLAHARTSSSTSTIARTLAEGLQAHDVPDKDYETHVAKGRREGIRWEPKTEPTDSHRPPDQPPDR
jgi:hypothetical protein